MSGETEAAGSGPAELIPRPDPSKLTDAAIERATAAYRRELDALRELLAERIQTEVDSRDRAVTALKDVLTQRIADLDAATERRLADTHSMPDRVKADRHGELQQLRELIDTRLTAMDKATDLVAVQVRTVSDGIDEALASGRNEFAAADTALRELVETRLSAMDKATELLASDLRSVPGTLEERLKGLRELIETRLSAMDKATELLAADLRAVPSNLDERVKGLRDLIEQRLDGIDRATELRLRSSDQLPATTAEMIDQLRKLHEERFSSIVQQFAERDTRGEQEKKASKEALDAALLAQKESVSQQNDANTTAATKTETNFTKQIDLVGSQITALDKSLTDRISELKERIDRGEGSSSGSADTRTEQRLNVSQVIAVLAVIAAAMTTVLLALKK